MGLLTLSAVAGAGVTTGVLEGAAAAARMLWDPAYSTGSFTRWVGWCMCMRAHQMITSDVCSPSMLTVYVAERMLACESRARLSSTEPAMIQLEGGNGARGGLPASIHCAGAQT